MRSSIAAARMMQEESDGSTNTSSVQAALHDFHKGIRISLSKRTCYLLQLFSQGLGACSLAETTASRAKLPGSGPDGAVEPC